MSIISPFPQNTQIYLYEGIPWGNDYSDIRLFESELERDTFLQSKIRGGWGSCSIVKNGRIRLTGQINDMVTCNYMSFRNYGAGQIGNLKTFYCFVTSVEYININTVEIQYEIDWIQSYLFDFSYGECFIEREHVTDDTFGLNTLPEEFETGEMSISNVQDNTFEPAVRLLYLSPAQDETHLSGINGKGTLYAVNYLSQNETAEGYPAIDTVLSQLNSYGGSNDVADMCMTVQGMSSSNGLRTTFNVQNDGKVFTFGNESYTAVNNKMQCYPYKFMTIDNYEGSVEQYRYENFSDTTWTFAIEGTDMPKPCMECFPINYQGWNGSPESPNTAQQSSVMYTNFPEIPWTSDTFRAWVSQNQLSLAGEAVGKIVQTAAGVASIASGNIPMGIGLTVSGLKGAVSMSENIQQHKLHSHELRGGVASAGMSYLRNTVGFRCIQYCLRPEYAKRIDRHFTRYGYTVNASKVPNIRGRQYVNYCKCKIARVDGNIPVDAKNIMENALTKGVSFWHTNSMDMEITTNPIVGV